MFYDVEQIMNNANSYDVAIAIGMEVIPRCGKNYIHCPGHMDRLGKMDNTPNNAILTEKGYYCFACGCSVNLIQMVEEYYKNYLGQTLNFSEILGIIADTCGGREMYSLSQKKYNISKKEKIENFILSKDELQLIGIKPQVKIKNYLFSYPNFCNNLKIREQQEKRYFFNPSVNDFEHEFVVYNTSPCSIYSFYLESPNECIEMLLEKTTEKMENLREKIRKMDEFNPEDYLHNNNKYDKEEIVENMRNLILKAYFKCREIEKKLKQEIDKTSDDIFLYENMYKIEKEKQEVGPF